ncbi:MAG: LacI family DNA-binding transcriptional regulator [Streptosporangiaceae bacterium]
MSSPAAAPPVTLKDVAALAGVHPATASRALRQAAHVADSTAESVLRAARTLRYVPDLAAASLRTQRTRTAGVLAADLADPLVAPLLRGAEDALREAGYMMLAASAGHGRPRARDVLSGMHSRRADGVIFAGLARLPLPVAVCAGIPAAAAGHVSARLPSASTDLAGAAALAAAHLAALGHRTAACIGCARAPLTLALLLAAARRAGLTVPPDLAVTAAAATAEEGQRCCRDLLAAATAVTAIMTGSDLLAAGCCTALAAAGRPCPAAMSVTGFGDLPLSGSITPPLTTIRLPQYDVGAAAAGLLLAQLRQPDEVAAADIRLNARLLPRQSTAQL